MKSQIYVFHDRFICAQTFPHYYFFNKGHQYNTLICMPRTVHFLRPHLIPGPSLFISEMQPQNSCNIFFFSHCLIIDDCRHFPRKHFRTWAKVVQSLIMFENTVLHVVHLSCDLGAQKCFTAPAQHKCKVQTLLYSFKVLKDSNLKITN